ncbi:MAG: hypothetical protein A2751_04835 [Candidatus Doudnabacteria bacterium RIFCSPHIGHO2_01_FULL_46_14]|uniref:Uncharacterized protein n=1 Tax=Candidatus Doudnabacteria bacterium RIFCSPHIGHO2_01_FULL_46_14 TaxID=1817824 RepID=A0A1F5NNT0_9BACT|nr:MAG: hypothetical protein A2751_04835 [Candidatus Doudnabacteria bacterium RIFCSPHIGHO2_01_FULL_46_14]
MIKKLNIIILLLLIVHLGFLARQMGIKYVLSGPVVLEIGFFGLILILETVMGKLKINKVVIVIVIATCIVGYLTVAGVAGR